MLAGIETSTGEIKKKTEKSAAIIEIYSTAAYSLRPVWLK
jgi:hypothetical protein